MCLVCSLIITVSHIYIVILNHVVHVRLVESTVLELDNLIYLVFRDSEILTSSTVDSRSPVLVTRHGMTLHNEIVLCVISGQD